MLDRVTFLEVLTMFCEMLGRAPLSKPSLEMYYRALADMSTDDFTAAATRIVRERKFTSLPTPADFLEGLSVQAADRGMVAAEDVLGRMRSAGGDADVQFEDQAIMVAVQMAGGWPFLCDYVNSFDLDKLGIWKREFAALYRAASARKGQAPRVLLGRHSQSNAVRGYLDTVTGELKNADGVVVRLLPWGTKAIAGTAEQVQPGDEVGSKEVLALLAGVGK